MITLRTAVKALLPGLFRSNNGSRASNLTTRTSLMARKAVVEFRKAFGRRTSKVLSR